MKGQAIWLKMKLVTVEPVLFFYMMIIFLESNALQDFIYVKSCLKYNSVNISDCNFHKKGNYSEDVTNEAISWIRFNGGVLFFFTFLSSFFVASWSDKFGRKLSMMIPPLGTIIAASINCVLSVFIHTDIAYLCISSAVSGVTFGTVGIIASTFGFISDISDESSRTKRMMILEAMTFAGGTVGIYIAGKFLKYADYDLEMNGFTKLFIFEISVAVLITLYVVFRIPYHRDGIELTPVSCGNLFKFDHVKNSLVTVFRPRDDGKRKTVLLLLLALFFIYFGITVQLTLNYLFLIVMDGTYWKFERYSLFNSAQFAVEGITLLSGMPIFLHLLHLSDHFIASIGIISKMVGYIIFGISSNSIMVYSCIALFAFSEYPVPVIRSMLSKTVDADEKGRIFAFTTMLQNFCFLLGSLMLTSVFRATETFFPGLCFEIVACLQCLALCIIIFLYLTRGQIITIYEIMENEDGSVEETCNVVCTTDSLN